MALMCFWLGGLGVVADKVTDGIFFVNKIMQKSNERLV